MGKSNMNQRELAELVRVYTKAIIRYEQVIKSQMMKFERKRTNLKVDKKLIGEEDDVVNIWSMDFYRFYDGIFL